MWLSLGELNGDKEVAINKDKLAKPMAQLTHPKHRICRVAV
tara:strand:- start:745 stop:867 length:123 start_codon:yes stop_codon:yes gene_type:complete